MAIKHHTVGAVHWVCENSSSWSSILATFMRFAGSVLPSGVGSEGPFGSKRSDGRAGHLSYGPYIRLEPGRYVAGVRLKKLPECGAGRIDFDVFSPETQILCAKKIYASELFEGTSSLIHLEFSLESALSEVEVRLYVQQGVLVQQDEIVVFSKDARGWNG